MKAPQPRWLSQLFETIDAKDAAKFARYFTAEGRFAFSSAPEVVGRGAVEQFVGGFFDSIAGLSHTLDRVFAGPGGTLVSEGRVTYTRLDGSTLEVPFCNVYSLDESQNASPSDGPLIRDYRVYGDFSQLYAAAA
ncbi:MAG: nuclear transport factor 2 family protein [Myxococcales bacterium]|nr:nuclear transport factor 2 family protein [Myxococcales bacterium]